MRTSSVNEPLESPAIVQERLAPLSFSSTSSGRQLATLDLVGVVSALTDPDAGRRAEVARYLLLQAHQRQPSESPFFAISLSWPPSFGSLAQLTSEAGSELFEGALGDV